MKKNNTATSLDVAKLAGVSQSTVSRVFNPNWQGNIKQEIREKVLKASEELGYTPNALAHILNSNRSKIIGVAVSKEYDEFYGEVLNYLVNEINGRGYYAMVFATDMRNDINDVVKEMLRYRIDGAVITASALSHQANIEFERIDLPIVLYNGYLSGMNVNAAYSDNYGAGIMMADYLVKAGHKRFAYVSTEKSKYSNFMTRQDAFIYGLSRHGIRECIIQPASYSYESGIEAARKIFSDDYQPDAIFCAADKTALGIIDVAKEMDIKLGEDLSITGFFAPVGVDLPAYSLTCFVQDIEGLAQDAIDLLLEQIDNPSQPPSIRVRPMTLVQGKSSRKLL